MPSTTIAAATAQMTLDWVLPIHSNTSQRALFSWKIWREERIWLSSHRRNRCPDRDRSSQCGWRRSSVALRRGLEPCKLARNLSAESAVPASPQGGRSVVLADEAISLRRPRSHGAEARGGRTH